MAAAAASAPVVAVPFSRVMSAGEAVRIRGTQFTAVPFRDGQPSEAVMPDTFNIGPGERWATTIGPAPAGGNEIVSGP